VDDVHKALERVLPADGQLQGDHPVAELLAQRVENTVEVRVLTIHLVDQERAG